MKKILFTLLFPFFCLEVAAQNATLITYDYPTRALSPATQVIPFDKPFTLVVLRFPGINIKSVFLYEVTYENGRRMLHRVMIKNNQQVDTSELTAMPPGSLSDSLKLNTYLATNTTIDTDQFPAIREKKIAVRKLKKMLRANGENYLSEKETQLETELKKDSLFVSFLAVRPSKYFDLEVNAGLSPANLQTMMDLNKAFLTRDTNWQILYDKLVTKTTEVSYESRQRAVNINFGDTAGHRRYFFTDTNQGNVNWTNLYNVLLDSSFMPGAMPAFPEIKKMAGLMVVHKVKFDNINCAIRIATVGNIQSILHGLLPANYISTADAVDYYDFPARINNLDSSKQYFNAFAAALEKLIARADTTGGKLATVLALRELSFSCSNNESALQAAYKKLLSSINSTLLLKQSYMFGNDNLAADLKTRASFSLTTDLGVTNIFARDYRGNLSYIPKLFFGVNIYFRQVDKTARIKDLGWKIRETGLLSSRNPLQYISFSLGLTIGGMSNSNFYNLYNSFSLTAGPSVRLSKAFRFTGGLAFLDRTRANPLITTKQFITGGFVAFSVDIDFLTPIQKVTDLLFK